ncbi:RNA helicase (Hel) [Trachipleistophora hominis]|uniref:ATP-dependent RNA helicase n=1 Tax=Trachipleistophora hominis TaxID=72359 RepID=L7K060_TRAHO|nr:RNA helicase (Hel) [Trachipleistophora hominis]
MSSLLKYVPLPKKQLKPKEKKELSFYALSHRMNQIYIPFKRPTKVQKEIINAILNRKSAIFLSNTGSGKSYGYSLGLAIRYHREKGKKLRAVIVLPTKELVEQMYTILKQIVRKTIRIVSLSSAFPEEKDRKKLENDPEVVVTTAGRFKLVSNFNLLILDEVDLLLREGFAIDEIRNYQLIGTSATFNNKYNDFLNLEVVNVQEKIEKNEINLYMRREEKVGALEVLFDRFESIIVFASSRVRVEEIVLYFKQHDKFKDQIDGIHGDLDSQFREQNCLSFKRRQLRILVVTDVASRGLNMNATCIVNYDIADEESLIHRKGRIVRGGTVVSFFTFFELKFVHSELFAVGQVRTKDIHECAEKSYEKMKGMIRNTTNTESINIRDLAVHSLFTEAKPATNEVHRCDLKAALRNTIDTYKKEKKAQKIENKFKDQFYIPYNK